MKQQAESELGRVSAFALAITMMGMASTVVAQEAATLPPAADAKAVKLEKIEVTGSRIKRGVDAEGASPIVVITRAQIDREGYNSVTEVLENLSQNSGGTLSSQGSLFGTTAAASSIDLRSFGAGRTLTLIDGRRLPIFPNDFSGSQSADLSSIPFAMVERIEVLTDGASAIYGSDAVGGVVNIITKKNFKGTAVTARMGGTEEGGYENQRAQVVSGSKFEGGGSFLVTADYFKHEALPLTKRDYAASDFIAPGNGSLFGSNFAPEDGSPGLRDPNCGTPADSLGGLGVVRGTVCRFDRSQFRQFFPDYSAGSFSARLDFDTSFGKSFSRVYFFENSSRGQAEPNAYGGGEGFRPPSQQVIDPSVHNFGTVPAGAANNPTTGTANEVAGNFQRRLVEFGPRREHSEARAVSLVQGFAGSFGAHDWEAGLTLSKVNLTTARPNIISSLLDNEVANNGLDLFQPIPQSIVDRFSFSSERAAETNDAILDATLSGPLAGLKLQGGAAQYSLHVDLQRTSYKDIFDPLTEAGDTFDGGVSGAGSRKYAAIGGEVSLPVLDMAGQTVNLNLAGRYDRYYDDSKVGGAFSPKASLEYRPRAEVLVRGSYARIFRAPSLQDLFGGQSIGFSTVSDPTRCTQLGGTPDDTTSTIPACNPNDPFYTVQSAQVATGSNPDLKEETGKTLNIGFVVDPIKELSLSLDYYEVELKDIVSSLGAQEILDFCNSQSLYCDQIIRPAGQVDTNGDGQTLDEPGVSISATNLNLAFRKIRGLDGKVDFRKNFGSYGAFSSVFQLSYLLSVKTQSVSTGPVEEVINSTPLTRERIPEKRMSWSNDWSRNQWGLTVRANWVDEIPGQFAPLGLTGNVASDRYIDRFVTVDTQLRFAARKNLTLRLGIDNVLDENYPIDPTAVGGNYPNQFITGPATAYVDPRGRSGYMQVEYKF